MVLRFFLGANSGEGFFSLYPQLCREEDRRIFVIKSGPGSGKSTAMRRLAQVLGDAQEEILCSSDPSSLDGVIWPCWTARPPTSPSRTSPAQAAIISPFRPTGTGLCWSKSGRRCWR